jgi:hypothetical protein
MEKSALMVKKVRIRCNNKKQEYKEKCERIHRRYCGNKLEYTGELSLAT